MNDKNLEIPKIHICKNQIMDQLNVYKMIPHLLLLLLLFLIHIYLICYRNLINQIFKNSNPLTTILFNKVLLGGREQIQVFILNVERNEIIQLKSKTTLKSDKIHLLMN
jgi:flagellar biogenesis protein FliO